MKIKNIKKEVIKDMENLREKKQKHSGRPLQKTRTNRRQNLRTQR
jgi:hypothetical protein